MDSSKGLVKLEKHKPKNYKDTAKNVKYFPVSNGSSISISNKTQYKSQINLLRRTSFLPRKRLICKIIKILAVVTFFVLVTINFGLLVKNLWNSKTQSKNVDDSEDQTSIRPKDITIEVLSSQSKVSIKVDGAVIKEDNIKRHGRGIHMVVLNEATGSVMAQRLFDTYFPHQDDAMLQFLQLVSNGRIIIFAIKDEGSFQMKQHVREYLKELGSNESVSVGWRDMWAMVTRKGDRMYGESHSKSSGVNMWGSTVTLKVKVPLFPLPDKCPWPENDDTNRRIKFCDEVEGFSNVCTCKNPSSITFNNNKLPNSKMNDVPIAVISSNKPQYLFRMLQSLMSAKGANPEMVTVFVSGYFDEPVKVASLFGVRGVQQMPVGKRNVRIALHYKSSIVSTFKLYPDSKYILVLEEDLDIAMDIFSYFSQTLESLENDPTLFCISAWNDLGYKHTSSNISVLYRVESIPGFGILIKRSFFEEELQRIWPTYDKRWDWDTWIHISGIRKERECIIPEVSRTYHFGALGIHVPAYFHDPYFNARTFNQYEIATFSQPDRLLKYNYEQVITNMVRTGYIVDHSKSPCETDFIPDVKENVLLIFIKMNHSRDYSTWLEVAKCFKIWDVDARGYHRSMWRMRMKGKETLVIGVPSSDYSQHKPANVTPIFMEKKRNPNILDFNMLR